MRGPLKRATSIALLVLAAASLGACGGGGGTSATTGSSASSTSAVAPGTTSTVPSPKAAPATAPAKKPTPKPVPRRESPPPRDVRKAGPHAAPFLVPTGDNSVPTYGSEGSASQRGAVEAALRSYLSARAASDWGAACAQMAATMRKQIGLLGGSSPGGSAGCAPAYAKLASRAPAAPRASPLRGPLAALRVKDGKAFALFYGPPHRQQYMMPLEEEGGAWRVNQLEPIPWPIGTVPSSP